MGHLTQGRQQLTPFLRLGLPTGAEAQGPVRSAGGKAEGRQHMRRLLLAAGTRGAGGGRKAELVQLHHLVHPLALDIAAPRRLTGILPRGSKRAKLRIAKRTSQW